MIFDRFLFSFPPKKEPKRSSPSFLSLLSFSYSRPNYGGAAMPCSGPHPNTDNFELFWWVVQTLLVLSRAPQLESSISLLLSDQLLHHSQSQCGARTTANAQRRVVAIFILLPSFYWLLQKKGPVLLSTSQAQPDITFSQLSDLFFARLCTFFHFDPCPFYPHLQV